MQTTLDICRELYNAALQERRDGYRTSKAIPDGIEKQKRNFVERNVKLLVAPGVRIVGVRLSHSWPRFTKIFSIGGTIFSTRSR